MNKALCISAAMALALSSAAFADHTKNHKSSARSDSGASAQQFTESDCQMLSVESARSACMRSTHASARTSGDMATGATSDSGSGMTQGGGDSKRMHKRSKKQGSGSTAAQGASESSDSAR
jgi:hypothetical protein